MSFMICPPQTSGGKIKKHEMGRNCRTYEGEDRCMRGSGGKTLKRRPPGRARCKWEFNIKTDVMEICWRAWTALIWMCENAI
jgi:hypothetical protein